MKEFFVKRYIFVSVVILSLLVTVSPQTRLLRDSNSAKSATTQRPTTKPTTGTQGPLAETVNLVNKQLGNGLEVIVLEDHSEPLVTVELAVRNGSYTEPPELNGLSHLYEHMFFKANRAIANQEDYLQKIGQLGIAYNSETREEGVENYFSTTSPNLSPAIHFMRNATR